MTKAERAARKVARYIDSQHDLHDQIGFIVIAVDLTRPDDASCVSVPVDPEFTRAVLTAAAEQVRHQEPERIIPGAS